MVHKHTEFIFFTNNTFIKIIFLIHPPSFITCTSSMWNDNIKEKFHFLFLFSPPHHQVCTYYFFFWIFESIHLYKYFSHIHFTVHTSSCTACVWTGSMKENVFFCFFYFSFFRTNLYSEFSFYFNFSKKKKKKKTPPHT